MQKLDLEDFTTRLTEHRGREVPKHEAAQTAFRQLQRKDPNLDQDYDSWLKGQGLTKTVRSSEKQWESAQTRERRLEAGERKPAHYLRRGARRGVEQYMVQPLHGLAAWAGSAVAGPEARDIPREDMSMRQRMGRSLHEWGKERHSRSEERVARIFFPEVESIKDIESVGQFAKWGAENIISLIPMGIRMGIEMAAGGWALRGAATVSTAARGVQRLAQAEKSRRVAKMTEELTAAGLAPAVAKSRAMKVAENMNVAKAISAASIGPGTYTPSMFMEVLNTHGIENTVSAFAFGLGTSAVTMLFPGQVEAVSAILGRTKAQVYQQMLRNKDFKGAAGILLEGARHAPKAALEEFGQESMALANVIWNDELLEAGEMLAAFWDQKWRPFESAVTIGVATAGRGVIAEAGKAAFREPAQAEALRTGKLTPEEGLVTSEVMIAQDIKDLGARIQRQQNILAKDSTGKLINRENVEKLLAENKALLEQKLTEQQDVSAQLEELRQPGKDEGTQEQTPFTTAEGPAQADRQAFEEKQALNEAMDLVGNEQFKADLAALENRKDLPQMSEQERSKFFLPKVAEIYEAIGNKSKVEALRKEYNEKHGLDITEKGAESQLISIAAKMTNRLTTEDKGTAQTSKKIMEEKRREAASQLSIKDEEQLLTKWRSAIKTQIENNPEATDAEIRQRLAGNMPEATVAQVRKEMGEAPAEGTFAAAAQEAEKKETPDVAVEETATPDVVEETPDVETATPDIVEETSDIETATPDVATEELGDKSYRDLQQMAKERGIKANQKKDDLIEQLQEATPAETQEAETPAAPVTPPEVAETKAEVEVEATPAPEASQESPATVVRDIVEATPPAPEAVQERTESVVRDIFAGMTKTHRQDYDAAKSVAEKAVREMPDAQLRDAALGLLIETKDKAFLDKANRFLAKVSELSKEAADVEARKMVESFVVQKSLDFSEAKTGKTKELIVSNLKTAGLPIAERVLQKMSVKELESTARKFGVPTEGLFLGEAIGRYDEGRPKPREQLAEEIAKSPANVIKGKLKRTPDQLKKKNIEELRILANDMGISTRVGDPVSVRKETTSPEEHRKAVIQHQIRVRDSIIETQRQRQEEYEERLAEWELKKDTQEYDKVSDLLLDESGRTRSVSESHKVEPWRYRQEEYKGLLAEWEQKKDAQQKKPAPPHKPAYVTQAEELLKEAPENLTELGVKVKQAVQEHDKISDILLDERGRTRSVSESRKRMVEAARKATEDPLSLRLPPQILEALINEKGEKVTAEYEAALNILHNHQSMVQYYAEDAAQKAYSIDNFSAIYPDGMHLKPKKSILNKRKEDLKRYPDFFDAQEPLKKKLVRAMARNFRSLGLTMDRMEDGSFIIVKGQIGPEFNSIVKEAYDAGAIGVTPMGMVSGLVTAEGGRAWEIPVTYSATKRKNSPGRMWHPYEFVPEMNMGAQRVSLQGKNTLYEIQEISRRTIRENRRSNVRALRSLREDINEESYLTYKGQRISPVRDVVTSEADAKKRVKDYEAHAKKRNEFQEKAREKIKSQLDKVYSAIGLTKEERKLVRQNKLSHAERSERIHNRVINFLFSDKNKDVKLRDEARDIIYRLKPIVDKYMNSSGRRAMAAMLEGETVTVDQNSLGPFEKVIIDGNVYTVHGGPVVKNFKDAAGQEYSAPSAWVVKLSLKTKDSAVAKPPETVTLNFGTEVEIAPPVHSFFKQRLLKYYANLLLRDEMTKWDHQNPGPPVVAIKEVTVMNAVRNEAGHWVQTGEFRTERRLRVMEDLEAGVYYDVPIDPKGVSPKKLEAELKKQKALSDQIIEVMQKMDEANEQVAVHSRRRDAQRRELGSLIKKKESREEKGLAEKPNDKKRRLQLINRRREGTMDAEVNAHRQKLKDLQAQLDKLEDRQEQLILGGRIEREGPRPEGESYVEGTQHTELPVIKNEIFNEVDAPDRMQRHFFDEETGEFEETIDAMEVLSTEELRPGMDMGRSSLEELIASQYEDMGEGSIDSAMMTRLKNKIARAKREGKDALEVLLNAKEVKAAIRERRIKREDLNTTEDVLTRVAAGAWVDTTQMYKKSIEAARGKLPFWQRQKFDASQGDFPAALKDRLIRGKDKPRDSIYINEDFDDQTHISPDAYAPRDEKTKKPLKAKHGYYDHKKKRKVNIELTGKFPDGSLVWKDDKGKVISSQDGNPYFEWKKGDINWSNAVMQEIEWLEQDTEAWLNSFTGRERENRRYSIRYYTMGDPGVVSVKVERQLGDGYYTSDPTNPDVRIWNPPTKWHNTNIQTIEVRSSQEYEVVDSEVGLRVSGVGPEMAEMDQSVSQYDIISTAELKRMSKTPGYQETVVSEETFSQHTGRARTVKVNFGEGTKIYSVLPSEDAYMGLTPDQQAMVELYEKHMELQRRQGFNPYANIPGRKMFRLADKVEDLPAPGQSKADMSVDATIRKLGGKRGQPGSVVSGESLAARTVLHASFAKADPRLLKELFIDPALANLAKAVTDGQGRIHIFLDRHHDNNDVVISWLHEAVGHHGLKAAFGDLRDMSYDAFLDSVANRYKAEVSGVLMRMDKEWDASTLESKRRAAEEVVARMIENAEVDSKGRIKNKEVGTYFDRVVAFVHRQLRKLGLFKKLIGTEKDPLLTRSEIRTLAAKAYKGVNVKYAMGLGRTFREIMDPEKALNISEFAHYEGRVHDDLIGHFQDGFQMLKRFEQALAKEGVDISDRMSAYRKSAIYKSATGGLVTNLMDNKHFREFVKELGKYKLVTKDKMVPALTNYVIALRRGDTPEIPMGMTKGQMDGLVERVKAMNMQTLQYIEDYGLRPIGDIQRYRANPLVMPFAYSPEMSKLNRDNPALGSAVRLQEIIVFGQKNEVKRRLYLQSQELKNVNADAYAKIFEEITYDGPREELMAMDGIMQQEDVVSAWVDGELKHLRIKHKGLAKAMNHMSPEEANVLLRTMARGNQILAQALIKYNPHFWLVNLTREIVTGTMHLAVGAQKKGMPAGTAMATAMNVFHAARAMNQYMKGNLKEGDVIAGFEYKYIVEHMEGGGKTGYYTMAEQDKLKSGVEKIEAALARETGTTAATMLQNWDTFTGIVDRWNTVCENAMRLSLYQHLRKNGWSAERAVLQSKDMNVNFDRRGTNQLLNSMHLFFNASVQGIATTAHWVGQDPKKATKLLSGIYAAGFVMTEMARLALGTDEDGEEVYGKASEWRKNTSLIIPLPFLDKEFLAVPLPYVFAAIFNMGRIQSDLLHGQNPVLAMANLAGNLSLNFNPLGGEVELREKEDIPRWMMQTVSGSLTDPFVELIHNKNWRGTRIYDYDDEATHWENAWLAMRHVLNTYGGGASKFVLDDLPTNAMAITGGGYGSLEAHQRITRRFIGSIPNSAAHEAFWGANAHSANVKKDIQQRKARLKTTFDPDLRRMRLEELRIVELENRELLGHIDKRLQDVRKRTAILRGQREATSDPAARRRLDDQMAALEKEWLYFWNQAIRI